MRNRQKKKLDTTLDKRIYLIISKKWRLLTIVAVAISLFLLFMVLYDLVYVLQSDSYLFKMFYSNHVNKRGG